MDKTKAKTRVPTGDEYSGMPTAKETANGKLDTMSKQSTDAQLPMSSSASFSGKSPPGQRRRGRGLSKRPCLNRNALIARENRQKKKHYIQCIMGSLKQLRHENHLLKDTISKQQGNIKQLKQEVHYLQNVLANAPEVEKLLSGINAHLGRFD